MNYYQHVCVFFLNLKLLKKQFSKAKIYFLKHYSINIKNREQPLLISRPKEKDKRREGGQIKNILLIPELCVLTGKVFYI